MNVKIVLNSANAFTFDWLLVCSVYSPDCLHCLNWRAVFVLFNSNRKKWSSCSKGHTQTLTNSIGSKFRFGCAKIPRQLINVVGIYLFSFSAWFSY